MALPTKTMVNVSSACNIKETLLVSTNLDLMEIIIILLLPMGLNLLCLMGVIRKIVESSVQPCKQQAWVLVRLLTSHA
jgi:hypothetical protein